MWGTLKSGSQLGLRSPPWNSWGPGHSSLPLLCISAPLRIPSTFSSLVEGWLALFPCLHDRKQLLPIALKSSWPLFKTAARKTGLFFQLQIPRTGIWLAQLQSGDQITMVGKCLFVVQIWLSLCMGEGVYHIPLKEQQNSIKKIQWIGQYETWIVF